MDKDYACGDIGGFRDWVQIKVTVKLPLLDRLSALMSMVSNNLMIEDFSDIDLNTCYGELIDDSILNADKTIASVSVFVPADGSAAAELERVRALMAADGVEGTVEAICHNENDWANSWKSYYKPLRIGERIVIVPQWEEYTPESGDVIVRMDPGMAFGTGSHETTRLVIALLEKYTLPTSRVLDVGCGSGILAICAAKLGAEECAAYDIDPMAARVARENAEINNVGKTVTCGVADLLRGIDTDSGRYDVVCANIVADIIIRMAPDVAGVMNDGGVLLASGIIAGRTAEVEGALCAGGLTVCERLFENDWCALVLKKTARREV